MPSPQQEPVPRGEVTVADLIEEYVSRPLAGRLPINVRSALSELEWIVQEEPDLAVLPNRHRLQVLPYVTHEPQAT